MPFEKKTEFYIISVCVVCKCFNNKSVGVIVKINDNNNNNNNDDDDDDYKDNKTIKQNN